MNDVINLRQKRKEKARGEKEKKAAENRRIYGRTKAEKLRDEQNAEKLNKLIDGHKLEPDDEK